jgi:magnesium chelatase subunit H
MPKRTSAADGPAVRVVHRHDGHHLASAASAPTRTLARELPGLTLSVHAAAEWGDDRTR